MPAAKPKKKTTSRKPSTTKKRTTTKKPTTTRAKTMSMRVEEGHWESPALKVTYYPGLAKAIPAEFVPKEEKETEAKIKLSYPKKKRVTSKKPRMKATTQKKKKAVAVPVTYHSAKKHPSYLLHAGAVLVVMISVILGVMLSIIQNSLTDSF